MAAAASAQMRITEWMYNGVDGEFIEFTNVGNSSIDMAGWSFDDSSRTAGSVSVSGFGVVAAGQSVILCEPDEATFRASWGGLAGVFVIGQNDNNLGRSDEINLYDSVGNLVDRLTYDDQNIGGPRTNEVSGNLPFAQLGANRADLAVASAAGDAYGSWLGSGGDPGNPGRYAPVPEPVSIVTLGLGAMALIRRRRRA